MLRRLVLVEMTLRFTAPVPASWSAEMIEFNLGGQGSLCVDNTLEALASNYHGCGCLAVQSVRCLRDATEDDLRREATTWAEHPARKEGEG